MARRGDGQLITTWARYLAMLISVTVFSTLGQVYFPFVVEYLDLFLITAVIVSVRKPVMSSQLYGMSAGLFQDAFTSLIIGIHGLSLLIISFVISSFRQAVLMERMWKQCLAIALATVSRTFLLAFIHNLYNLEFSFSAIDLLIKLVVNTSIGSLILHLFYKFTSRDIDVSEYEKH